MYFKFWVSWDKPSGRSSKPPTTSKRPWSTGQTGCWYQPLWVGPWRWNQHSVENTVDSHPASEERCHWKAHGRCSRCNRLPSTHESPPWVQMSVVAVWHKMWSLPGLLCKTPWLLDLHMTLGFVVPHRNHWYNSLNVAAKGRRFGWLLAVWCGKCQLVAEQAIQIIGLKRVAWKIWEEWWQVISSCFKVLLKVYSLPFEIIYVKNRLRFDAIWGFSDNVSFICRQIMVTFSTIPRMICNGVFVLIGLTSSFGMVNRSIQ